MDRINRGRKRSNAKSVERAEYNKSDNIQKLADNLEQHLFKNENE